LNTEEVSLSDSTHPDESRQWRMVGVLAVLALVMGTLLMWGFTQKFTKLTGKAGLPVLRKLNDAAFTRQDGSEVRLSDLRGRVWVADFVFTRCSGPCPVMSANMSKLYQKWVKDAGVRFVSFTVDPEFDTPKILSKYANRYGVNDNRWWFLTGDVDSIRTVAVDGFAVGDVENLIYHSEKFVLVDRGGKIRGYYEGTDEQEVDKLNGDIRRLLRERIFN